MKIRLSVEAVTELRLILEYRARDDIDAAQRFIRDLQVRATKLTDMPTVFPLVPRYEQEGVRQCMFRNHLIFFKVDYESVCILHVIHDSKLFETLLLP